MLRAPTQEKLISLLSLVKNRQIALLWLSSIQGYAPFGRIRYIWPSAVIFSPILPTKSILSRIDCVMRFHFRLSIFSWSPHRIDRTSSHFDMLWISCLVNVAGWQYKPANQMLTSKGPVAPCWKAKQIDVSILSIGSTCHLSFGTIDWPELGKELRIHCINEMLAPPADESLNVG